MFISLKKECVEFIRSNHILANTLIFQGDMLAWAVPP